MFHFSIASPEAQRNEQLSLVVSPQLQKSRSWSKAIPGPHVVGSSNCSEGGGESNVKQEVSCMGKSLMKKREVSELDFFPAQSEREKREEFANSDSSTVAR